MTMVWDVYECNIACDQEAMEDTQNQVRSWESAG